MILYWIIKQVVEKTNVNIGTINFTWSYTAAHDTAKWPYYMTKTGGTKMFF